MRSAQRLFFPAIPVAFAALAVSHGGLFERTASAGPPVSAAPTASTPAMPSQPNEKQKEKVKFTWATPSSDSVNTSVGSEARYATILNNTNDWGIKGKEIRFVAHSNGGDITLGSVVTSPDGGGALMFRGPAVPPGTYTITAKFNGDSQYEAASLTGTMHLKKSPVELVMEPVSGSNPAIHWVAPAVKRTTNGEHLNRYLDFYTWENDFTPPQKQRVLTGVPMAWGSKSGPTITKKIRIEYAGDDTTDSEAKTWPAYHP
jgi:hypothetical protein